MNILKILGLTIILGGAVIANVTPTDATEETAPVAISYVETGKELNNVPLRINETETTPEEVEKILSNEEGNISYSEDEIETILSSIIEEKDKFGNITTTESTTIILSDGRTIGEGECVRIIAGVPSPIAE